MPEAQIKISIVGKSLFGLEQFANVECGVWDRWDSVSIKSGVAVVPLQALSSMSPRQIETGRLVVVVHHPHDPKVTESRKTFRPSLFAHVGEYSFWSNFSLVSPAIFLPNTLVSPVLPVRRAQTQEVTVGYLGALVPPKRFHDVASVWSTFHSNFPSASLEIIGGASLYGHPETHPLLPTSREYGDKILDAFGSSTTSLPPDVTFHGNVAAGKAEIMSRWTVGVINPTGNTEAFPYSAREILRLGLPLIAGRRQGLSELMCYFPQFRITRRNSLADILGSIGRLGIDENRFHRQRDNWLSRESRVSSKVDRLLPALITRLNDGGGVRLLQLKLWPAPRGAVLSALIHERTLAFERSLGRLLTLSYVLFRKLGFRR